MHTALVIIHTAIDYVRHQTLSIVYDTVPRLHIIYSYKLVDSTLVQSGYFERACLSVYQLEIISTCVEMVWQCDTSCISGYHALLLVDMDCKCMGIGSGVPIQS